LSRKVASQQMMILSAAISMSRDVTGRYPNMVNQTNLQMQTKPQYSTWLKSVYYGTDTMKTPTVVQMEKKSYITADDDPLCCENFVS
jgi:hypothetical protein